MSIDSNSLPKHAAKTQNRRREQDDVSCDVGVNGYSLRDVLAKGRRVER